MNLRILFFSAVFANSILSLSAETITTQLTACPVVYFDVSTLSPSRTSKSFWSFECAEDSEAYERVRRKAYTIAISIAKRLGASSIVRRYDWNDKDPDHDMIYIDPAYDITREVIDTLNKEYLAKKPKTLRFSSPQDMLHQAILNDSADEIKHALQAGANVNLGKNGKSPLLSAILLKRSKAVGALLELGAAVDNSLISHAVKLGEIKSAVLIAKRCGTDINAVYSVPGWPNHKFTLAQLALRKDDLETFLVLVKNGADFPDKNDDMTSCPSSVHGQSLKDIVLYNLYPGNKSIDIALELLQEMVRRGYNINDLWFPDNMGSLGGGVYQNKNALIFLIKNGANPNYIFERKQAGSYIPLIGAICSGNKEAIKILLDAGADINQKANPYNQGLQTPLSFALSRYRADIVEFLLERGAIL